MPASGLVDELVTVQVSGLEQLTVSGMVLHLVSEQVSGLYFELASGRLAFELIRLLVSEPSSEAASCLLASALNRSLVAEMNLSLVSGLSWMKVAEKIYSSDQVLLPAALQYCLVCSQISLLLPVHSGEPELLAC